MTVPTWLPIAISSVALMVSLASLAWQIGKHLLDGSRLRITLEPAEWNPGFSLGRVRSRDGRYTSRAKRQARDAVECAVLTVENIGRGAATFTNPGISYRTARPGPFRRKGRYSATPRIFGIGDIEPRPSTSTGPHRLEPRSQISFVLDVHSLIPSAKDAARGQRAVIRPCVSVPGRRHPLRGSWRWRWRIPAEAATLLDYGPTIPLERQVLLHLARAKHPKNDAIADLGYRARLIAMMLWRSREGAQTIFDRLGAAVEGTSSEMRYSSGDDRLHYSMAIYDLGCWIEENEDAIDWTGAQRQFELSKGETWHEKRERRQSERSLDTGGSAWYF